MSRRLPPRICRVCLLKDASRAANDKPKVSICIPCEERLRDPRMVVSLVEALRELVGMSQPTLGWTSPFADARHLLESITDGRTA